MTLTRGAADNIYDRNYATGLLTARYITTVLLSTSNLIMITDFSAAL